MEIEEKNTLTEGSIPKKIIAFAIPLFLGQLFQQMYNMADSLIVGNCLGSEALAAVTSTGALIFLLVGFFSGTAMGAGVLIARYYGAKDVSRLRIAVHTNVAFGIICGVLMTIIGIVFTPQILKLMGTPADVLPNSVAYLRVYFGGSLAVILYNICVGILQAVGDSKHPLYYLIISSCTNVVLDLLFCGMLGCGVEFAALATIVSQFLSVFLCLRRLTRIQEVYQIHWKEVRVDREMIKSVLKLGLPSGVQNSIISLANIVVQSNINAFGKMAMAGCGAHSKIEGFCFLPITCFSMALTTFVGQNLGAKKYERVKKGTIFGIICALFLSEGCGILMNIFAPQFVALFDRTPQVIAYGTLHARTVTLFYFLLAFSHVAAAIMRGAGKAVVPMLVMMVAWCAIRVTYITIVAKLFGNIQLVLLAYPITWTISSVIFLVYMLKADWMHGFDK